MKRFGCFLKAFFSLLTILVIYAIGSSFSDVLIEGFSVLLLVFIAALIVNNTKSFVKPLSLAERGKKEAAVWSTILSAVFMLMLPLHKMLSSDISGAADKLPNPFIALKIILPILLPFCLFILIFQLFNINYISGDNEPLKRIRFFRIYYVAIPIVFVSLLFMASTSYNNYYPDPITVFNAALLKEWDEWHTMGFLLLFKICTLIIKKMHMFIICETIIWIYINNYVIGVLFRKFKSKKVCKAYSLISVIIFTPYMYLQYMVKDVVFSMFLLGFSAAIIDFLSEKKLRWRNCIPLLLFGSLTALMRHMAIYFVIIAAVFLLIYSFIKDKEKIKKSVALVLVPIMSYLLIVNVISYNVLDAKRNPGYIKYGTPLMMLGAIAASGEQIDESDKAIMEKIMPIDEWSKGYNSNPYWVDELSRTWGHIRQNVLKVDEYNMGSDIIKLNAKYFARYPSVYLSAFFKCNSIIWEISCPPDGYEWKPIIPEIPESSLNNITRITKPICDATLDFNIFNFVYWRGGIWLFVLLCSTALMIYKRRLKEIIAILPIAINTALMMLVVPAQDPRFALPMLECGVFFIVYAVFEKKKKTDKKSIEVKLSQDELDNRTVEEI